LRNNVLWMEFVMNNFFSSNYNPKIDSSFATSKRTSSKIDKKIREWAFNSWILITNSSRCAVLPDTCFYTPCSFNKALILQIERVLPCKCLNLDCASHSLKYLEDFLHDKLNKQRGLVLIRDKPPTDVEHIRIEALIPFCLVSKIKKLTRREEHMGNYWILLSSSLAIIG